MTEQTEAIGAEAARWHLATLADDCDWDGFTRWLEADPRNARAYDEIALADDLAANAGPALREQFTPDGNESFEPLRRARWPLWGGGAIAASLALALGFAQFAATPPQVYASQADSREISLADGSRVILAPASRLTVDGNELAIDGGGYFAIRHDPARRMVVHAGTLEVTDIGTAFDVQTGPAAVRIAVAEGRLTVRGEALAAPVDLPAGKRLALDEEARQATVSSVARDAVGSWRRGDLTFEDAPLALVAADLARYTNTRVTLAPGLGGRRFSGTLSVARGAAAIDDLAQLVGLSAVREGRAYRLEPAT